MKPPQSFLLAGALALLAGCDVTFVEPGVIRGFARQARVEMATEVVARGCGTTESGARATVCLGATVYPGLDRYGRSRRLLSDTLWALGTPLLPASVGADSTRSYVGRWAVPEAQLAGTPVAVRYPVIEGVPLEPAALSWSLVGRAGPDTLRVAEGGTLVVELLPPRLPSAPLTLQAWALEFGGVGTITFRGSGFPRSSYRLPESLLAELLVNPVQATLSVTQYHTPAPTTDLLQYQQMRQVMDWTVRRTANP